MIQQLLQQIRQVEQQFSHDPNTIAALEQKIEQLTTMPAAQQPEFFVYRNEFRIRHAAKLRIKRPKLLIGFINCDHYPNFQTFPLLLIADIVTLSNVPADAHRADRLYFNIFNEDLAEKVLQLPAGFIPDYYWDPQACGTSFPLPGQLKLPCPTVAGICHTFRGLHSFHLAKCYDYVAPVSAAFVSLMRQQLAEAAVLDIPFGGNWGSFHLTTTAHLLPRDIDVLVSFSPSECVEYCGARAKIYQLVAQLAEKYQHRLNIALISNVDKDSYSKNLARAKIAINVVGFNGPYNYRTCEIINHGCLLMQYRDDFGIADNTLDGYFTDGLEYVAFDEADLEQKMLHYLNASAERQQICKNAKTRLETAYSYPAIHTALQQQLNQAAGEWSDRRQQQNSSSQEDLILTLSSAPLTHQHKHLLHAVLSIQNFQPGQSDRIRDLVVASRQFKLPVVAELLNNHAQLACLGSVTDLADVIDLLFGMLPADAWTVFDFWSYACLKAEYGQTDQAALQTVLDNLLLMPVDNFPEVTTVRIPFEFAVPDSINARTEQLDIPLMCLAGDDLAQKSVLKDYMIWWCGYFIER
jgi:hypothetical protein